MTLATIPAGSAIFLDANSLIHHFTNDAKCGPACTQLIKRVEQQQLRGLTRTSLVFDRKKACSPPAPLIS